MPIVIEEQQAVRAQYSTRPIGKIRQKQLPNWLYCGEIDLPVSTDGTKRTLELRFNEADIDEEVVDPLDALLLPLTTLLIDHITEPNGKRHGYEDVCYHACDGTFIKHGYRKFVYDGIKRIYVPVKYQFDGDPSKFNLEQDHLSELTSQTIMHHRLQKNPVVLSIQRRELWKLHSGSD
jgi:hypothetical protein